MNFDRKPVFATAGNRLISASAVAMVFGSLVSFAPAESLAYTKCDISSLCAQTAQREGSETRSRISVMQEAISRAVNLARTDIVAAIGQSTSGIASAVTKTSANASNSAAELDKARSKREVDGKIAMSGCGSAGASQGPRGGGSGTSSRASGPGSDYKPSNVHPRLVKAMNASGMTSSPEIPADDASIQAAHIGVGGCAQFSDPRSIRGMFCDFSGTPSQGTSPFPDADVRASTLFDGPQLAGATSKVLSVPKTGPARDARNAFLTIQNYASPPVTPPEYALRTVEGKVYMGLRTEYDNAKSTAAYPSLEFDRLSTVDEGTRAALQIIEQEDAPFLQRYFNGMDADSFRNGVSPMMLMDIEVERRIGNADWLKRMAAADDVQKDAERLVMEAYAMRIKRDHYVAQLQTNVLLGKLLQNSTESHYRGELEQSRLGLATSEAGVRPLSRTSP